MTYATNNIPRFNLTGVMKGNDGGDWCSYKDAVEHEAATVAKKQRQIEDLLIAAGLNRVSIKKLSGRVKEETAKLVRSLDKRGETLEMAERFQGQIIALKAKISSKDEIIRRQREALERFNNTGGSDEN